ncbi:hypothetical protein DL96DRAFT_874742 [Flagelloscypha sp. PMI_526]|nr:hypothetical protein DL96DRAFT_874742 [Flagelloscypha sp. PMI_526]
MCPHILDPLETIFPSLGFAIGQSIAASQNWKPGYLIVVKHPALRSSVSSSHSVPSSDIPFPLLHLKFFIYSYSDGPRERQLMTGVHVPFSPPLVLTRQLATGNPLSSNGCRSSTTTIRNDGNEDESGWRYIAQEKLFLMIREHSSKQGDTLLLSRSLLASAKTSTKGKETETRMGVLSLSIQHRLSNPTCSSSVFRHSLSDAASLLLQTIYKPTLLLRTALTSCLFVAV